MNATVASPGFVAADPATYFRSTAKQYRRHFSPFYEALSDRCADDAELMALAGESQPGQPLNFLFFGAIHFVVLSHPDDRFAAVFGGGATPPQADEATFAALKDFCRRRRGEILDVLKTRIVQYTTASRTNVVLPLLGHLMRKGAQEPLSLIEVGCSAGLLTIFDQFYYDFGALGQLGDPASPQITTAVFQGGTPPIPSHLPKIAQRVGIDLNPIDPTDPLERRWLEALLAPDMTKDRKELSQALDLRAATPLETLRGDAMEMVPQVMARMQDPVCILHFYCLTYWPAAVQNKFDEMLRELSRDRTIYRAGIDFIADNPARPAGEKPANLTMDITAVTYRNGEAEWEILGRADALGRELVWAG